jgi:transcriptional regulator with XRE-family HTH domain
MAKSTNRVASRYTQDALALLAAMIREARLERKMPARELAERAGISRGLLQRIEKGDPNCGIGVVFEVAHLLGITLFECDSRALSHLLTQKKEKLSLLPKAARKPLRDVDDDF